MRIKAIGGNVLASVLMALSCSLINARATSLVDTSFNPGSGADGFVETVLAQPDGKILVSGNFTHFNSVPQAYLIRLNSDGSIDTSFSAQPSYWVRTMALQPDGKIVIGGFFNVVEGESRNLIARLNPDGSIDRSFDPGTGASGTLGVAITGNPDPFVFATAVQNDGKILITGNFTNYNGTRITGLARLNSNGSLDTTFNVGDDLNTWGRSLTLMNDGRFIVTGWFNHYHNGDHSRMAIVSPDGSADSSFAPNFGDSTAVYSAIPLPNGQYIVSGHSEDIHKIFQQDIARLNSDGSFDTSFVGSANDKTEMVRLQSDGKILLCGYFGDVDGVARTSVARLNPDGTLDDSFNVNVDNFAWSMFIQPDGRILVAGGFHTVDGYSRSGIVRLYPSVQPEDQVPPNLLVTTPGESVSTVSTATLNVMGTADDSNGVASVTVTVNGDTVFVAETDQWTATAGLLPGTNVVVFSATDTFGNVASLTRYIFHPGKTPLIVTTDGNGTVTPNLNNSMIDVARKETITAIPKPGFIFGSWSGSVTSSSPNITFTMNRGMALQATFVPNPFTPSVGVYRGLAFDSSTPAAATAGTVYLSLQGSGLYTARLVYGGISYAFSGRFDANLTSSATVSRGKTKPALHINLQLADSQTIQGTVSDGTSDSTIVAHKAAFDSLHPATGFTGQYTVLLIGNGDPGVPSGYGYVTISTANAGSVVVSGALADGTRTVQVTPLAANGEVPFYLSSGGGTAFGWLTLTPNDSSDTDVQGTIHWEKSSRTNLMFSVDTQVLGSVYRMPHSGTAVLALTNPTLEVDGGTLVQPLTDAFTLDAHNRVSFTAPNSNRFTLALTSSSGRFFGSFTDPSTRRGGPFQGVVLQKQNIGGGFFSSNRTTGRVFLGETGATAP